MEWRHFTRAQYITTAWSGGTTTQLAIAPEGAVYADRKFLWRLSSAQVELEHSDFTPLPDYDRLISVLKGELELKIGQGERGEPARSAGLTEAFRWSHGGAVWISI